MQTTLASVDSAEMDHASLRRVLTIDCAVSALSGVAFILAAEPIARWTNIASPIVVEEIGAVCLAFALFVGLTIRQVPMKRRWATLVVLLNGLGVLLSDAALLLDPFKLSAGGKVSILVCAVGMAVLALAEWNGLRRGRRQLTQV